MLLTRKKTDSNTFASLLRPRKTVYGVLCAPWFSLLPTTTRSTDASNEDNWWCWLSACRPRASSRPSATEGFAKYGYGGNGRWTFLRAPKENWLGLFMYKERSSLCWALLFCWAGWMILVGGCFAALICEFVVW